MRTLLLTENLKIANFIRQGMFYENVFPDVILISDNNADEIQIPIRNHKIIMIYEPVVNNLGLLIEKIRILNPNAKVFILAKGFLNSELDSFVDGKFVIEVFVKPLQFKAIAAKVRSGFYNIDEIEGNVLVHRDLVLNVDTRELSFKGRRISLRNKDFALLHFFILNKGKLLSRMMILENVWDSNANIFTNTVDVHISRLRRILKTRNNESPYIQTVPCSGYIFS